MITSMAKFLGMSIPMTKAVLCCVGGVVIFLGIQWYTNRVWDKAVAETRLKVTKEIAREMEKKIEAQREELLIREQKLEERRRTIAKDEEDLWKLRRTTEALLTTTRNEAKRLEAVRYAEISKDVKAIPGDKLDDAIRAFIARYRIASTQ